MKLAEPTFESIPQFTKTANYHVDVAWSYLDRTLEDWKKDYGLELEPDFQRAHVWDKKKQSAYVEFVLRGGKSSKELYFNSPAFGRQDKKPTLPDTIVLVDGLQRLTAVRGFMNNKVKAFGLYLKDFKGEPHHIQHRFSINVNDLGTRAEVLQWYIDLNAGGVAHTDEEIEKVRALLKKEKK